MGAHCGVRVPRGGCYTQQTRRVHAGEILGSMARTPSRHPRSSYLTSFRRWLHHGRTRSIHDTLVDCSPLACRNMRKLQSTACNNIDVGTSRRSRLEARQDLTIMFSSPRKQYGQKKASGAGSLSTAAVRSRRLSCMGRSAGANDRSPQRQTIKALSLEPLKSEAADSHKQDLPLTINLRYIV